MIKSWKCIQHKMKLKERGLFSPAKQQLKVDTVIFLNVSGIIMKKRYLTNN